MKDDVDTIICVNKMHANVVNQFEYVGGGDTQVQSFERSIRSQRSS